MTFFVRKVDMKRWTPLEIPVWVEDGDIHAEPMADFKTTNNTLSVFEVEDEACAKRAVAMVVLALNSTKDVGYSLIPSDEFRGFGFDLDDSKGKTLDKTVNDWHHNIVNLSGKGVIRLAVTMNTNYIPKLMMPGEIAKIFADIIKNDKFLTLEKILDKTVQQKTKEILENSGN